MAKPTILHLSKDPSDYVRIPRDSTTVVDVGDFISVESSKATLMNAATDDATFAGIAISKHESGNTDDVVVALDCVIEVDCVSATYTLGAGVKYNAGSATVDYKVEDDAGANTVGWSHRVYSSAVTRMEVRINAPVLQKLFEVNA